MIYSYDVKQPSDNCAYFIFTPLLNINLPLSSIMLKNTAIDSRTDLFSNVKSEKSPLKIVSVLYERLFLGETLLLSKQERHQNSSLLLILYLKFKS